MIVVRGCSFPDDRTYDPPNHVWYVPLAEGRVRVGLTEVAVALASRRIFGVTPKRVGKPFETGRSAATIESSKWVGPMRLAFSGTVAAINQQVVGRPALLVEDPYGAGWILEGALGAGQSLEALVAPADLAAAYEAWMSANDFPGCAAPQ